MAKKQYRVILTMDVEAGNEEEAINQFAHRVVHNSTLQDYEVYQLSGRGGEKYGTKTKSA